MNELKVNDCLVNIAEKTLSEHIVVGNMTWIDKKKTSIRSDSNPSTFIVSIVTFVKVPFFSFFCHCDNSRRL